MPAPSLRYRMEAVRGEMRTGRIEYILGLNTRSESRDCRGYCDGDPTQPGALRFEYGPLRAVIHNHDLHYCFQLDLEARVYTASRIDEHGAMRRIRSKPMSERRSGRTVQIHTQTVDTGEHREMFGHTARRVITRTTRMYDPETGSTTCITEVDGWYIDPPSAWLIVHPPLQGHAILLASADGRFDTPVFTDDGLRETGFPLLLTRTCHTARTDSEGNTISHSSEDWEEVAELSEEDLEFYLFVPSKDFRRVPRLPGERPLPFGVRTRIHWERLKNALLSKC